MFSALRIAALTALLGIAQPLSGQVYDGWIVVSSFRTTELPSTFNPLVGDGGLWLVHPRIPGPPIQVSGLGSDLTGHGVDGPGQGANCVLRMPDGRLLVGETGSGVGLDLHVLTLQGTSVAPSGDAVLPCGFASILTSGGIHQLALLPDGRVLMAVWGIVSGPLAGDRLGIADLALGTVTPVVATGFSGDVNAVAVDHAGSTVYLGVNIGSAGALYSIPAGGGPGTFIQSMPANIMNLAVDNDGGVLVGCFGTDMFKVDPTSGIATPLGFPPQVYNALVVERVTGNYVVMQHVDASAVPAYDWISLVEPGPTFTQLLFPPPEGIGVISGIDLNPDPETFGDASPGANLYEWKLTPNPGGLPSVGDLSFSLTLQSSPGGAPGVLVGGLAALSPPLAVSGTLLLVDLSPLVVFKPVAGVPTQELHLPVPPDSSLVGVEVFLQSGHVELGGFASSAGIKLTIL